MASYFRRKETDHVDTAETLNYWSGQILALGMGAHLFSTRLHSALYPHAGYEADFSLISYAHTHARAINTVNPLVSLPAGP